MTEKAEKTDLAVSALVGAIQKFSTEDGPGIRTTVFLKGCPLRCRWCHNPELIAFEQQIIRMPNSCIHCSCCLQACPQKAIFVNEEKQIDIDRKQCTCCMECTRICFAGALKPVAQNMSAEEVLRQVEQDKTFYDHTGGGMTISGGELLAQPEFASALIRGAAARQIFACLDTSGFGDGDRLQEMAAMENVTDILFDLKALDDEIHRHCTGLSNRIILDNLRRLAADPGIREKLQMRMPLVAGINDSLDMMKKTAAFYRTLGLKRVTLLPYHSLGTSKKKHIGEVPETFRQPEDAYVEVIKDLFEQEAGMTVEIQGKVR